MCNNNLNVSYTYVVPFQHFFFYVIAIFQGIFPWCIYLNTYMAVHNNSSKSTFCHLFYLISYCDFDFSTITSWFWHSSSQWYCNYYTYICLCTVGQWFSNCLCSTHTKGRDTPAFISSLYHRCVLMTLFTFHSLEGFLNDFFFQGRDVASVLGSEYELVCKVCSFVIIYLK